ncbi:MAG: cyclic-di-AMP receptor [Oscillospiraceae bacterium]|jgi:uncharacterized protein YaaQ
MKLIIAVINHDDTRNVTNSLSKNGIFYTKLSTSGGLLRTGNTTLMTIVEDDRVKDVLAIYEEFSHSRKQLVIPAADFSNIFYTGQPVEISVGGATIAVLDVEQFYKL